MESLFGTPIGWLTATLVGVVLVGVAIMTVAGLRNRIIVKMAVRNIPRRRAQTVLIVLGLMLATLLFSSSFATGDTLAHSIRVQALERIGFVDEVLFSTEVDETGRSVYFDLALVEPKYAGKNLVVEVFDAGDAGSDPGPRPDPEPDARRCGVYDPGSSA